MAQEPPTPSGSTVLVPFLGGRARRGSLASLTSHKGDIDKDVLAQALDHIHTSASRSETLTSFHDYDGGGSRASAKEVVSSGVSGLYDKFIRGLGGASNSPIKESKEKELPKNSAPKETAETESIRSNASNKGGSADGKKQSPADSASVLSKASAAASPRAAGFNISGSWAEPISTEVRQEIRRGPGADKLESNNTGIDTRVSRRDDSSGTRKPQSAQESPVELDRARAWNALNQDDRSETAMMSLGRILTNHDIPIGDKSKPTRSSYLADVDDDMNDDTKNAQKSLRSPSVPLATASNSTTQFKDHGQPMDRTQGPTGIQQPPTIRIGTSRLSDLERSRTSSTDTTELASITSSQAAPRRRTIDPSPNINDALQRKRNSVKHSAQSQPLDPIPSHLKRRVISKAFWMKDENARDCFYCGQAFSTFRRKHHCRTCGQIFDAKCTNLVPGEPFGQLGKIRLCKPCEAMIYGSDDESTVWSDDGTDFPRSPLIRRNTAEEDELHGQMDGIDDGYGDVTEVTTPSIGIPASRRNREAKRRSAVIEFDAGPSLVRPASSHSLISLARRPRSSSHRRQHSRQQITRGPRAPMDDRVPFHPGSADSSDKRPSLPAFHNDNIIDPDLAAFASDEEFDDDDQQSIFAAMNDMTSASPGDRERMSLSGFITSGIKKGRSRLGTAPSVRAIREEDPLTQATKHLPKLDRNRNPSAGSMSTSYGRPSPRRSRSNNLLKPALDPESFEQRPDSPLAHLQNTGTKLVRSSAMRGRDAPPVELNHASLQHVRRLLAQLLKDAKIETGAAWEKALIPILLQCTDDVEPNVQLGDDMDIRHYVKLKKIPGGKPGDTSYVSGIVFSKNIALKSMARSISHPRIAIVTFALEYARAQTHFMSLEPVIAQEQEYLRNLVGRIAALKPQLLLVQRHVSGSALDLLDKAGITVVYNIKESVLAAVARVTQTTMIKSVDKLAIDPSHLGQCDSFEVKTYVHEGARNSYVYLSGCQQDLGCTIVLRGNDTKTLRKIKRVTEFMCYVTYNLKLETNLLRDEFVAIPSTMPNQLQAHDSRDQQKGTYNPIGGTFGHGESVGDPHIHEKHSTLSRYEKMEVETKSKILSASPFVVFMQPYLLTQLRDTERRLTTYKKLRDQYAAADKAGDNDEKSDEDQFEMVKPEMVHVAPSKDQPKTVRDYLHAVHEAQLEKTTHTFETQQRLMDSFMSGPIDPFDPFHHQTIIVLASTVSTINSAPCVGPEMFGIAFYAGYNRVEPDFEEDCTLGQFIEDSCQSANSTCKECGKKNSDHYRQYVHGYGQLSLSVTRQSAKMRGYAKTILMWATCRICKQETTVTPMSDNTWKYSFAKYLELSFWSSPLHPRAGVCEHDIHKDFMRCFGFEDLVVKVQYDPIDIYDVVVPRTTITWRVESDLKMKNDQFSHIVIRLNAFTESIKKRLDSIHVDTLDEKKALEAQDLLDELRQRAEDDHRELLHELQIKYADSRYYELVPLNRALRFMDEKALAWDGIFSDFERDYFPSETDIRKLATLQLKNMFLESQPPPSNVASDASDDEEEEEKPRRMPNLLTRGFTDTVLRSDKVHDVLSSTVEEHRDTIANGGDVSSMIHDEPEASLENGLSRKTSPRDGHEHAVEREDVKHLDLAVTSKSPDDNSGEERSSSSEQSKQGSRPGTRDGQSTEEPFATQTKPLGSGLLERIEQIRSNRPSGSAEQVPAESKIPRPVNIKRDASPRPSPPPLLRAQSSPSPPHHVSRTSEHSIDSVAGGAHIPDAPPPEKRLGDRLGVNRLASKMGRVAPSLIPRSIPLKSDDPTTRVSALAKHFEQLSREFEKERLKERRQRALRSRQGRANPLASSRPVVEVYRNATDAVGDASREHGKPEPSAQEPKVDRQPTAEPTAESQPPSSDDTQPEQVEEQRPHRTPPRRDHARSDSDTDDDSEANHLQITHTQTRDVSDPTFGAISAGLISPSSIPDIELASELTIPEHKKNVWFKYLADFWSKRSASGWTNLEYPLHANEHVFEDSDIIVREDEPSSVIALSLSCADYQIKVGEFRNHPKKHTKQQSQSSTQADRSFAEGDAQNKSIEDSLLSDTGTHMKYSFAHGQVKASCKIFYAESFDALRRRCGVADRFVESLSRCLKFDSKGGKTKSLFLKTFDNRFYIKSLQEVELKAFTKFAPDYFAFMSHTLFHGVPSVIAKMFGVFQVVIKNPATGLDFSYYLLVMENLFYERNPNRRFDLKGSMRNRKIESTGQPDEVLLDENLVETIFESPLFVREHARKLLQASVWNDTMWLCKQNVMDYSLMAGFDDERKELIVGIIDCIRTYTWDKKLESWIKDRGKNKPTITSPKDYRNRFRVSMMQYVLSASSPWSQFQAQMPMPKTLKGREQEDGEEMIGDRRGEE